MSFSPTALHQKQYTNLHHGGTAVSRKLTARIIIHCCTRRGNQKPQFGYPCEPRTCIAVTILAPPPVFRQHLQRDIQILSIIQTFKINTRLDIHHVMTNGFVAGQSTLDDQSHHILKDPDGKIFRIQRPKMPHHINDRL